MAIFLALIWFYILLRYVKFRYVPMIVCFLWALEVLEYAYRDFLPMDVQQYLKFFDYFGSICFFYKNVTFAFSRSNDSQRLV